MPKLQNRFFVIVGIIALIILLIAAAAASPKTVQKPQATPTPDPAVTPAPTTLSFTVKPGIGLNTVTVTNQNTGATIILTAPDLPITFNFQNGDTLTFKITPSEGYKFNAWIMGDGTFQNQNPYTLKATATFTMEPKFIVTGGT
jgi:hypothetical protein